MSELHVTVAAVIERDGKFLVVEETSNGDKVFNQPAGHLEPNEDLEEAVQREVLEETGWPFTAKTLIGIYRWCNPHDGATHIRVCFSGEVNDNANIIRGPLDVAIIDTHWLNLQELEDKNLRSSMVLRCIRDYLAKHTYPLDLFQDVEA